MAIKNKIGLVLSGGGARGAYEVGVLKFIREKLYRDIGVKVKFDIFCGTSIGAINACYLAATAISPQRGLQELIDVWLSMRFEDVVQFGLQQLLRTPRLLLGDLPFYRDREGRLGGLLNTMPLERLVMDQIPWSGIRQGLQHGLFEAISVTATDVMSGLSTVFIERRDLSVPLWSRDRQIITRPTRIRPEHALASAAIPVLFPAIMIEGRYYTDGGVRQNTPISPALRLGANKLLVIGLRHEEKSPQSLPAENVSNLSRFPGLPFIIGKILNALLLDHLDYDLDRLKRFNTLLEGGKIVYGPDFENKINGVLLPMRQASYRHVEAVAIRPSVDLGYIASLQAKNGRFSKNNKGILARYLKHTAISQDAVDADLLSYLLFDADYARDLIELGYQDAANKQDELARLFLEDIQE